MPGAVEAGDLFGGNTRLPDFGKDGNADLAVSAPGENGHSGAAWSLPGSSGDTTARGAVASTPRRLGTAAAPKATFGSNVAGSTDTPLKGREAN
ncbi:hypothetical protein [Streptomyces sp. NPDC101393]|uniref:hypothetical protein n=1 Tax=Streptomyces sp. NPDC101393 TaxID=3366141 RepID=UPI0038058288